MSSGEFQTDTATYFTARGLSARMTLMTQSTKAHSHPAVAGHAWIRDFVSSGDIEEIDRDTVNAMRRVRIDPNSRVRYYPQSAAALVAVKQPQLAQQHQPERETVTHIPMRMC